MFMRTLIDKVVHNQQTTQPSSVQKAMRHKSIRLISTNQITERIHVPQISCM